MDSQKPIDEADIPTLHQALIDNLKQRGIFTSEIVESAFRTVPRHHFLPGLPLTRIYSDHAIATKSLNDRIVSSSSQPAIMALMLEQLQLQPGHHVLEIGAGTGYNAALIAHIVGETGKVVTIDIDEDIVENARNHLIAAGFEQVQVRCSDGVHGYADAAPYDRIILTVNAGDIAPAWYEQLKPGGHIVLPLSLRGPQVSVDFEHIDGHLESRTLTSCGFVGLRGTFAEPEYNVQISSNSDSLRLKFHTQTPVNTELIDRWLHEPYQDVVVPLNVELRQIYIDLGIWLALHEPQLCEVKAAGPLAEQNIIPHLFGLYRTTDANNISHTWGFLGPQSFCIIALRLDRVVSESFDRTSALIYIRCFGPDLTLAHQLKDTILAWDAAGRPDEKRLSIRAYPKNVNQNVKDDALLLTERWTTFSISWL